MTLRLEAGAGALELKDIDVTLPPAAAGKTVRSVKATLGGAAITATTLRTGNTVRSQWTEAGPRRAGQVAGADDRASKEIGLLPFPGFPSRGRATRQGRSRSELPGIGRRTFVPEFRF